MKPDLHQALFLTGKQAENKPLTSQHIPNSWAANSQNETLKPYKLRSGLPAPKASDALKKCVVGLV